MPLTPTICPTQNVMVREKPVLEWVRWSAIFMNESNGLLLLGGLVVFQPLVSGRAGLVCRTVQSVEMRDFEWFTIRQPLRHKLSTHQHITLNRIDPSLVISSGSIIPSISIPVGGKKELFLSIPRTPCLSAKHGWESSIFHASSDGLGLSNALLRNYVNEMYWEREKKLQTLLWSNKAFKDSDDRGNEEFPLLTVSSQAMQIQGLKVIHSVRLVPVCLFTLFSREIFLRWEGFTSIPTFNLSRAVNNRSNVSISRSIHLNNVARSDYLKSSVPVDFTPTE